jgi:hypothetical protein
MKRALILTFSILAGLSVQQVLLMSAGSLPNGEEVMRRVNARSRGGASWMSLEMTLHDARRGDFHKSILMQRKRFASGYRTTYWITAPDHENGIGLFLSEDADQRGMWMYFLASRQLIRVVTRGLSALASDFSCEDLLVEVPIADYEFRALGRDSIGEVSTVLVEMKPRSERLRSELGFSKSVGWVRDDIWLIVRADYYDENGTMFKTFHAEDIEQVQGIWTVRKFLMQNHRAQHSSEVRVIEADYSVRLPDEVFTPDRLGTGFVTPPK